MLSEREGLGGDRTCKGRRILGRFLGNSRSMDMAERFVEIEIEIEIEIERKGKRWKESG